jgi:hypothetical protein
VKEPEETDLLAALLAASEREREARERLLLTRDELTDRDERFAALEAELWARFEERERRTGEEIARHEREEARLREEAMHLREEAVRLRVRLDRIQASAPMRLYASFKHFPLLRDIALRRTRQYEATLHDRLRG